MTLDPRLADLLPFEGRLCVYVEDGIFSLARVVKVSACDSGIEAVMEAVPERPLVCYYRETPPRFAEEPHPVGDRWEISRDWKWFYPGEQVWDGSPYMGFRALFAPDVVERFLARDLSWVEEYF
jgi:hypothetical protein